MICMTRRWGMIAVAVGALGVSQTVATQADAMVFTGMRVARHSNVTTISAAAANATFADASNALLIDSGANDLVCELTLNVSDRFSFSGGGSTDVVDTNTQYTNTQFNGAYGFAVIVNTINICGGTAGSYAGCGAVINADDPFLMTRTAFVSAAGGVVLAHEFGHVVGNVHDDGAANQIMSAIPLTTTNVRTRLAGYCNGTTWATVFPDTGCNPGTGAPKICSSDEFIPGDAMVVSSNRSTLPFGGIQAVDYSGIPIESIARGFIVDTIPVEVEDYYGEQDLAKLRSMLADPSYEETHNTIATLIGLISSGSNDDVDALYIHGVGGSSLDAAMMALGYIVDRTGNARALDVLVSEFNSSSIARVSKAASLGLGLSGHLEALGLLRSKFQLEWDPELRDILDTAIEQNLRVAHLGVRGHYTIPLAQKARTNVVRRHDGIAVQD